MKVNRKPLIRVIIIGLKIREKIMLLILEHQTIVTAVDIMLKSTQNNTQFIETHTYYTFLEYLGQGEYNLNNYREVYASENTI